MKRLLLLALVPLAIPAPVAAQAMDHSNMPGMQMPAPKKPAAKPAPRRQPAAQPRQRRAAPRKPAPTPAHAGHASSAETPAPAADPHAGHDMATMPGMTMPDAPAGGPAGQDMGAMPGMDMGAATSDHKAGGTALPPGNAPAPAPPTDHYADRSFPPEEMARVRADLYKEHGGGTFHQVMFNLAEYQARKGSDGFRWDGEAWLGGDINRLVLKSEGEGAFRGGVDSAEIQALYSRAIDPYWNVQAGVRHDFQPNPSRTYATIGIEGLAPYWFEVEGALFLSDKGNVLARVEGYYDQLITQRLILQPRAELNFSAQDVPENRIGSGLSDAELGLRLRYEIRREFAPYVGISYERKVGDTARYARADGERTRSTSFVFGIRAWF